MKRLWCVLCLSLLPALATAADIDHLLRSDSAPEGVVFEVVEGDEDALSWAIPTIRDYVTKLRARFPDLEMAVVTHGREEFSLQSNERDSYRGVHDGVVALLEQDQVTTHVCGAHAGWFGVSDGDFPAYVDVVPAGPTQIRLYQELGWEVVKVSDPND